MTTEEISIAADTPPKRRKLPLMRKLLVALVVLFGLIALLAGLASGIERDDLTHVEGKLFSFDRRTYWDDEVLYLRVEGAKGRFKIESGDPGYDAFEQVIVKNVDVELWVETSALEVDYPAPIFEAVVDGTTLIQLKETQAAKNDDNLIVIVLGVAFIMLGFWIWHRATRPLPTQEETDAYEARL